MWWHPLTVKMNGPLTWLRVNPALTLEVADHHGGVMYS